MLDFLKKAGVTFYLNVAAGLLALIGWIIYLVTNATAGYAIVGGGVGIALGLLAVLMIAGAAYTSIRFGAQHYITAAIKIAAMVFVMVTLGVLLLDRVGLASSLLTWDSHNALGWSVFNTSIVCAVFLLLSAITLIVCAFFKNEKAETANA